MKLEIELKLKGCSFKKGLLSLFLVVLLLALLGPSQVAAQETEPDGPVYIVQEGDSLWDIASRFGLTLDELAQANGISDPSQLAVGARLVIPGLEGVQGVLTTLSISYGESLRR